MKTGGYRGMVAGIPSTVADASMGRLACLERKVASVPRAEAF